MNTVEQAHCMCFNYQFILRDCSSLAIKFLFCKRRSFPHTMADEEDTAEELVTLFKRKGIFDQLRRSLYKEFHDSVRRLLLLEKSFSNQDVYSLLINSIQRIVDEQANKDPTLLDRERKKAAALIEGTISRGHEPEYKSVGDYINSHTVDSAELREKVEQMVREVLKDLEATKREVKEKRGGNTKEKSN